jgi:uncharacterized phiE125 gp8 family phage protein
MALKVTTAPTELPVLIGEVMAHIRETNEAKQAEILEYMFAAVDQLDGPNGLLNRCLISQTVEYTMDRFPDFGWWEYSRFVSAFDLPLSPLQSVTSIKYLDENGTEQTIASSDYRVLNSGVETRRGRVELAYDATWPTTRPIEQAVTVTYLAGFGARNSVPWKYRQLIMAWVKELYDHRDPWSAMDRSPAFKGLFSQCQYPAV